MTLAHGVVARINTRFDRVVDVLKPDKAFSNVYVEVLNTRPRIAIAIGEKYFFRAGNYAVITLILVEENDSTIIKAVAAGSKKGLLDFTDLGVSRDYARDSINAICEFLKTTCEIVREVEYLDAFKSELLKE